MGDPVTPNAADGKRVVGVISGTSMDGVDVALLETDGVSVFARGPSATVPYTSADRALIRAAMPDAMAAPTGDFRTPALAAAEEAITAAHTAAIATFLVEVGPVDLIGWHGQTVAHAPDRGMTMQLGDGKAMAERLGIPVVFDFRSADVAAAGQGAPLVPVYHRALARRAGLAEPALFINLGGVANVTYVDDEHLIAFDTGPASALIDDAMAAVGASYDAGGETAARGRVDAAALEALLDHPYFAAPPPKSLDRDAFDPAPVGSLAHEDRIATLTRFSAEALAAGVALLPRKPVSVVASGGGVHNRTMMRFIEEALGVPVLNADAAGFSTDAMEAEAFAFLAARTLRGLPITYPSTTGVGAPISGGRLERPAA
ncbi:anhydro-N-acetylmuramic acid kinase [Acuticoccus sediminis]|uniref:Anhydro-N-acetylmuramic acid kinase n=1 Tax=Acuticoccus sediminis TaxID=2184697 RepID=A0A8B2NTZ4_9HYPH|nr:anhydro-N-acetylmuramic acid kinase [Acuticoccus sediminis]RAI00633.1 anhydro-N-acetylmuramic acid kinase [Acuticoccus sediminis]